MGNKRGQLTTLKGLSTQATTAPLCSELGPWLSPLLGTQESPGDAATFCLVGIVCGPQGSPLGQGRPGWLVWQGSFLQRWPLCLGQPGQPGGPLLVR